MGNEFKDFEMETPSLTLEPDLGEGRSACTDTGRTENGK